MTNHLAALTETNCKPLSVALIALRENIRHSDVDVPVIRLGDLSPVLLLHEAACLHQLTICRQCLTVGWIENYYLFTPAGLIDPAYPEIAESLKATKRILGIDDPYDAI